ncbi:putative oligopeptide ABC transporter (ATP binding protein) [Bradyrhizobium sp. ORS 375]|uniref:ABC transporter ATP-binding protein n=1 Tax=Bradyrhizobium sp. (strain ORS 375) TaxID=566679 RepID=UPI000240578D|nr:oligopeptide/dipeptide ABC transporter ATP-binding protein [Bradyrhizobium sp. ORS 375]CCD90631.1 putative oligopeptide ABC transporter (ATP binding protein) [Bradyrhizobium sp. ORS 375]
MTTPLVEVTAISRTYRMRSGLFGRPAAVHAVDGLSFSIAKGETLGIVGESGSGKSTTGRMVLGLEPPDAGTVRFDGAPIAAPGSAAWRAQRARMQMIFQDPLGALDRRLSVAEQIREPLDIHNIGTAAEREARVHELLHAVDLNDSHGARYPGALSGGQRQRIVLARALATRPDFLVCDEPVSALDVSIQAQVVNLLIDLQARLGLTMLFISHDLRVIRQISSKVAVMYLGRIVESGDADDLFARPQHPYTQALVSASPAPGRRSTGRIVLTGDPPNPAARPSGCAFHPRCRHAMARCAVEVPALTPLDETRQVACHLVAGPQSQTQDAA